MKKILIVLCALGYLCLALVGALTGLERAFLNPDAYTHLQDELDVYASVGLSREEQALVNVDLAAYLAGQSDSLEREVTLLGEKVKCAFNERELLHMQDVRRLFEIGFAARRTLAAAALMLLALPLLSRKRRGVYGAGLFWCAVIALAILSLAAVFLLRADFTGLFMRFHELLFTNDLWLLNPATDAMIRMFPEAFFERMAIRGSVWALAGALVFAALGRALCALASRLLIRRKS